MDSFIQRFSSRRWPIMMHPQSSVTKRLMETTEVWSDVVNTNPCRRSWSCDNKLNPMAAVLLPPSSGPGTKEAETKQTAKKLENGREKGGSGLRQLHGKCLALQAISRRWETSFFCAEVREKRRKGSGFWSENFAPNASLADQTARGFPVGNRNGIWGQK